LCTILDSFVCCMAQFAPWSLVCCMAQFKLWDCAASSGVKSTNQRQHPYVPSPLNHIHMYHPPFTTKHCSYRNVCTKKYVYKTLIVHILLQECVQLAKVFADWPADGRLVCVRQQRLLATLSRYTWSLLCASSCWRNCCRSGHVTLFRA
jgi:hypothetical protein